MSTALARLTELVLKETGIEVPAERQSALRSALRRIAPDLEPDAFLRAASDRVGGPALIERLIEEITVKETSFLRDLDQLEAIPWLGLKDRAQRSGEWPIRVWSAGCASGEEPYTLALLACEAFALAVAPVDVLGTDISAAALAAAAAGRYRGRAVQGMPPWLQARYLPRQPDDSYLVADRLRELVRFRRHNLVRGAIPPPGEAGFDLIACRNVLIYFPPPLARQVINALERALRPGGLLLLGAADVLRRSARLSAAVPAQPGSGLASGLASCQEPLRRPLGRAPARSREQQLTAALAAADEGRRADALAEVAAVLADDPLDADAQFIHGMVSLEAGDLVTAAAALRRALCADGSFALAAFTLGRAYDALGDGAAARRSYQLALRTLDPQDRRHDLILRQVDIGDIALAIQARLSGGDRPPGALGLRGDPGRPAGILPLSSWHGGKRGTG